MGLFDYLRNKFSKKKKDDTPVQEEEKKEETPSEEVSSASEKKAEEPAPVSSISEKEETEKPSEEEKVREDKKEELPSEEKKIENKEAYVQGMKKARRGFLYRLKSLTGMFHKVNEEYFDELEEILIEADVGTELTFRVIDEAKKDAKTFKKDTPEEINRLVIERLFAGYEEKGQDVPADVRFVKEGPTVLLTVGVNGGGKTTTIAKLAWRYKNQGKKVLLVAADTFRAGATTQLEVWAERIGVDVVTGPDGCDPSSLCYDGLKKAKEGNYDLVIVDTAGRLQNKVNLMNELAKMRRVMTKIIPEAPHETFLVIDANTGQNGIEQAKVFKEATPLTGIVITKMDGTSKGGIILPIRDKLGIPVRFIGLGEKMEDLKEFDLDDYLYGLLIGDENE